MRARRRPGCASSSKPYGFSVREDRFEETIPGLGRRELVNLIAVSPGRSNQAIVVMAHRDNAGTGPGANDNASGTAALIELARSYATSAGGGGRGVGTTNTIVFLSTDGGAFGGLGAARFAERSPYRDRTVAVVNLDRARRRGPAADRARGRQAALAGGGARPDRCRARPRADRSRARAARRRSSS